MSDPILQGYIDAIDTTSPQPFTNVDANVLSSNFTNIKDALQFIENYGVISATSVSYTPSSKTWSVPPANVNNTLNIVLLSNHGLSNGDPVIYYTGGGSPIAPLTNATTYYIRVYDANNVYLYDTAAHAINIASTTGLKDLGATGNSAQYFTTSGTGASTNITFDGTTNEIFVVSTTTVGNIIADITANLSNGQAKEYKFIVPGGVTNYTFTAASVNGVSVTGITSTITANITNSIDVLLVRLAGVYTIYLD